MTPATQQPLDFARAPLRLVPTRKLTPVERWRAFHEANPRVYETLVRIAREYAAEGHTHQGIKHLWEVMRYEMRREWAKDAGFKLNNNYPSEYAREIMRREPDLAGIFETRGRS